MPTAFAVYGSDRKWLSRPYLKDRCAIPAVHPALAVQNLYRAYLSGFWSSDTFFNQLIIKALALAY
jgi:hypothetical protein